jgi:GNAT superfamily N-acetyltransferase
LAAARRRHVSPGKGRGGCTNALNPSSVARYDPIVHIRPTALEDAEALTDLHLDVWDEAYADLIAADVLADRRANRDARVENWRKILAGYTNTQLVAEDDRGRLLGFTSVDSGRDEPSPDLPNREVMALYVRAKVYGTGVGYNLLKAAIGEAPAYLWVLDGNRRAIDFYERQGFRFDGTSKTEPVGVERRMVRR